MEQRGVGENAVETARGKIEMQEVLLPDFATAVLACHGGETWRTLEPDRVMTSIAEGLQIAAGAAAHVQDEKRRRAFDVVEQRRDVLRDVVISRAFPELLGTLVVVSERRAGDRGEILRCGVDAPEALRLRRAFAHVAAGRTFGACRSPAGSSHRSP